MFGGSSIDPCSEVFLYTVAFSFYIYLPWCSDADSLSGGFEDDINGDDGEEAPHQHHFPEHKMQTRHNWDHPQAKQRHCLVRPAQRVNLRRGEGDMGLKEEGRHGFKQREAGKHRLKTGGSRQGVKDGGSRQGVKENDSVLQVTLGVSVSIETRGSEPPQWN